MSKELEEILNTINEAIQVIEKIENDYPAFTCLQRLKELQSKLNTQEKGDEWISVEEKLPEDGVEVLGQSDKWIHPDFNNDGTRVCFINEGEWVSAKWNNEQDSWHTHAKWCCEQGEDFNPTHWTYKPKK